MGQDVSLGICVVLLTTSESVRKAMKLVGNILGDDGFWESSVGCSAILVVILTSLLRARAGTLSNRVRDATSRGCFYWCFTSGFSGSSLGLASGKYFPAGLHAAEASYVSSSSISAFRAAIVRAVWSS